VLREFGTVRAPGVLGVDLNAARLHA